MANGLEVSIVVATRNEEAGIASCLQSIFDAEPFATNFEVLVVDGDSTDGTARLVREFAATHPQVRLLKNPHRFAPQGFNTGIRAAEGDWIFILGAHSRYDRSYFRLCLETARRTDAENVGGCIIVAVREEGLQGNLARAVGSSRFGFGASPFRRADTPEGPADTAAFGCFPRRTFEVHGLYDERLVLNQVHQPVLGVDPAGPGPGQVEFQGLGLAQAGKGRAQGVLYQGVDAPQQGLVPGLPVQILLPGVGGEGQGLHDWIRSRTWAAPSRAWARLSLSRAALAGERRR